MAQSPPPSPQLLPAAVTVLTHGTIKSPEPENQFLVGYSINLETDLNVFQAWDLICKAVHKRWNEEEVEDPFKNDSVRRHFCDGVGKVMVEYRSIFGFYVASKNGLTVVSRDYSPRLSTHTVETDTPFETIISKANGCQYFRLSNRPFLLNSPRQANARYKDLPDPDQTRYVRAMATSYVPGHTATGNGLTKGSTYIDYTPEYDDSSSSEDEQDTTATSEDTDQSTLNGDQSTNTDPKSDQSESPSLETEEPLTLESEVTSHNRLLRRIIKVAFYKTPMIPIDYRAPINGVDQDPEGSKYQWVLRDTVHKEPNLELYMEWKHLNLMIQKYAHQFDFFVLCDEGAVSTFDSLWVESMTQDPKILALVLQPPTKILTPKQRESSPAGKTYRLSMSSYDRFIEMISNQGYQVMIQGEPSYSGLHTARIRSRAQLAPSNPA